LQDDGNRPAAVADRIEGLITGLPASAVEQQVDAARNHGPHLLSPAGGVVVEDIAGTQAQQVIMVGRAGHGHDAGAHGRRDLHSGAAHAPGGGGNEHSFRGLEPPPVDQALVRGTCADDQPGRLDEVRRAGHRGQPVR
jgi:hypothetical protein